MTAQPTLNRRALLAASIAAALLVTACTGPTPSTGPCVWIDVPTDGLRVPPDRPVRIEGHASHTEGVARVEVWVNEEPHLIEEDPPTQGNLAHFEQLWMPPGPGEYVVQVIAIGTDGSSSAPDSVRLHVAATVAEVTPTPIPTPEDAAQPPTETPTVPLPPTATPTQPPGHVIEFWADAEEVEAGTCIMLHWHTANVQAVYLDDIPRTGDGVYGTCPCSDETYTLNVFLQNGSKEQRTIAIRVTGSCEPPTPEPTDTPKPDTTAPGVPTQFKPTKGQEFDCVSEVMIRWDSVSDPSGIAEYRVQVERHSGDNDWQPVSGSTFEGLSATELELDDDVECGWYYRWRVRAFDGAGNKSPYSGWSEFLIKLM